jgi:hypothetical protein
VTFQGRNEAFEAQSATFQAQNEAFESHNVTVKNFADLVKMIRSGYSSRLVLKTT